MGARDVNVLTAGLPTLQAAVSSRALLASARTLVQDKSAKLDTKACLQLLVSCSKACHLNGHPLALGNSDISVSWPTVFDIYEVEITCLLKIITRCLM